MSDKMTPMPIGQILEWILSEKEITGRIFGVSKQFTADGGNSFPMFSERMETPIGPAAGPHTQLAQNIIAAYVAGARFFELKTVQIIDGEDLPVSKPCITAEDECYNVEWSTELYVPQALDEYVKAWFVCKLLAKEYGLGDPDGFVFNMSVGYDLEGIKSAKIDSYINAMGNAADTDIWKQCTEAAHSMAGRFANTDAAFIDGISPKICDSITLSTLHGCPPQEIENIATYLMAEKGINTFIKCNPTMLGYEYARKALDSLGFDYISFDDHHFNNDLQYTDAVPMFHRLQKLADEKGLSFGLKLTNTFPVQIRQDELPGEEMYMSGRSLYPLTISLAEKLTKEFGGKLRISFSGGADAFNIEGIVAAGIWPVTVATTLLKTGGYNRLHQMAESLRTIKGEGWNGIDVEAVTKLREKAFSDKEARKPVKPLPSRKIAEQVPLTDCFIAPCENGCPINQDIPAYVKCVGNGEYKTALDVIMDKNPLPFITGTICNHRCMDKCTRNFYEEPVSIRATKLEAAEKGMAKWLDGMAYPEKNGAKAAVIGGGPAGLAAAYFLARQGVQVTVYEKEKKLGGIVRNVIPGFRISDEAIENDLRLVGSMGIHFVPGAEAPTLEQLHAQGFLHIVLAIGAYKRGKLSMGGKQPLNVQDFLRAFRKGEQLQLGENVVIIGGGNSAMDAARAAKRVDGVKNVRLVYRRNKRYMPADEEELQMALDDGVEFMELLSPVAHNGMMLECSRMELGEPDESGRRRPVDTGERIDVPADTVIAAVGESVDDSVLKAMGVKTDERGQAIVDDNHMTNLEGVYIAGDARRGPATVVEAIADARRIADSICETGARQPVNVDFPDKPKILAEKGVLLRSRDAGCENERCLQCSTVCENCVDVCPNRANIAVDVSGSTQIVHIDSMCNECGNCETFCPYSSAPYKDKFTLFATMAEFEGSENSGFIPVDSGYKVRLEGRIFAAGEDGISEDIIGMMDAVTRGHAYMV